jgi:hypothetical protein
MRKREAGWLDRGEIQTFFDYIAADEERPVPMTAAVAD